MRRRSEFSRRRLENAAVRDVEASHPVEIAFAESASETPVRSAASRLTSTAPYPACSLPSRSNSTTRRPISQSVAVTKALTVLAAECRADSRSFTTPPKTASY